jgi:hypothetical protein
MVARAIGESPAEESSFYDSTSVTPYAIFDNAINQAESDVGHAMLEHGAEDALTVKSGSITFPASQEDVAWSSRDTPGALPGSKILLIEDTTNSLPCYIRMETMARKDRWDPASIYESPRFRELRNNMSDVVMVLYKDSVSVYPKFSSARTLTFYYVPVFGRMNGVNSVTVTAGGSGYSSTPTVTISATGAWGATATATLTGGAVTAVTMTAKGTDYDLYGATTVAFSSGAATATATVGVASVLPDEARHAMSYRAGQLLLRSDSRDESQCGASYSEALEQLVKSLKLDRNGRQFRRRPRFKGIIP